MFISLLERGTPMNKNMRKMFTEEQVEQIVNNTVKNFELIATGTTFNDGSIDGSGIDFNGLTANDLIDGLYMLTYANCYTFIPITKTALDLSTLASIKVSIPCVYSGSGEFRTGTLIIKKENDNSLTMKVIDNTGECAYGGLGVNLYKTNLF